MIQISNLTKHFGDKTIYSNYSLILPSKGVVGIMGPSGCGKTTLLRILAGLDKKYEGHIDMGGLAKPACVFQEPRLLSASDALENVALVIGNDLEAKKQASLWLTKLGLEQDLHTYPAELSGGMKQRVSIARALAYEGDFLLLDEPFNGIDSEKISEIVMLIKEYAKDHLCVIVTHDEAQIRQLDGNIINLG